MVAPSDTALADTCAVKPGVTVSDTLRNSAFTAQETRILVAHCLCLSKEQLITRCEHVLTAEEAHRLSTAFARRFAGEPIAYVTGKREFYGLSLKVTKDVLIPRADTELLVDLAIERAMPGAQAIDLGTGSGAIGIALGRTRKDLRITATDISAAALEVARENAALHRIRIHFIESSWYDQLDDERFDLIVTNPPYIVAGDRHLSEGDLRFEPIDALTDHADGLSALRILIAGAPEHLKPQGWLLLEHGYDQAGAVRDLLAARGFTTIESWIDLAGIERVSGGRFPG